MPVYLFACTICGAQREYSWTVEQYRRAGQHKKYCHACARPREMRRIYRPPEVIVVGGTRNRVR